jgi:uncharacterized coiled-coil protein SlyX
MEAARKRLEALLAELERTTASAEHTITEVRQALRELEDERTREKKHAQPRGGKPDIVD